MTAEGEEAVPESAGPGTESPVVSPIREEGKQSVAGVRVSMTMPHTFLQTSGGWSTEGARVLPTLPAWRAII